MEEPVENRKRFDEYRRLTIRVAPEKLRRLKVHLIEQDRTIQEWLERVLDAELRQWEQKSDSRACLQSKTR